VASSKTLTIDGIIAGNSGTGSLAKDGSGRLVLTQANTYTGATTVNTGALVVGGGGGSITSNVTVASGSTLKGSGTITGNVGITGTHAPGNSIGTQTISGTATCNSGSLFEWEMNYAATGEGTRGTNYDAVNAGGVSGSDALFRIVLPESTTFADPFWAANRAWTDIFTNTAANAVLSNWAAVFSSSLQFYNAGGSISGPNALTQGSFTLSGNSLAWQAVPEPGTALVGLLLGAGLLRRRRSGSNDRDAIVIPPKVGTTEGRGGFTQPTHLSPAA